jgi:2,3-dihydroxybiphenyl 1,2-dioxygenase
MVQRLGYLEIGVSSLADWRAYAEDVLGVACVDAGDDLDLRWDDACWRLRLVGSGEDDIRCAGFEVDSSESLQAIRSRLEGQGVDVHQGTAEQALSRQVDELLICRDPFGLAIEIYTGDRDIDEPFRSPRNVEGFVTGDQGLGHMVLTVADRQQAESFYMQGLGLLLSDHILLGPPGRELTLTFLHCNPRHHTLALAPVPAPKRLNHIMLQVTSLDDVGSGLDAAQAAGVTISASLGKHSNDRMISFYMATPSGFDIEYGYGGVEIDDATWVPATYHTTSLWGHKGL